VREQEVLELGLSCNELIIRGLDYEQFLSDAACRVLGADGGGGFIVWTISDPVPSPLRFVTTGGSVPSAVRMSALQAVVRSHPLWSLPRWFDRGSDRISDLVCLPKFWDTPQWRDVHDLYDDGRGRFPASLSLGRHSGEVYFLGLHRSRYDFSDEEMPLLSQLCDVLRPAFALRGAMDFATRRLQHLAGGPPDQDLSRRECEVLSLVARGWTSHRIGSALGITERTVRKHLGTVNQKLGVPNRAAAAAAWTAMTFTPHG
jgi:DNA-binding CsgD family transcriptional regulator